MATITITVCIVLFYDAGLYIVFNNFVNLYCIDLNIYIQKVVLSRYLATFWDTTIDIHACKEQCTRVFKQNMQFTILTSCPVLYSHDLNRF